MEADLPGHHRNLADVCSVSEVGTDAASLADVAACMKRTPVGSVCKRCGQSDRDPNPLIQKRAAQPLLLWRREYGLMCAICLFCIANDPRYCSMTAKELDELLTAPTERDIFVTQRGQYIDRNKVTGKKASPSAAVKANTVIQAMTADKVQYRKVIGNAWPRQVYKR